MTCPLGPGLQRRRILELDLAQPLRLELLLRQRHAPVEYLRVALDAAALEVEAADAVEGRARALGFDPRGVEREAVAGVADVAHRNRIEELPTEVAATLGEVRQHLLDGLAPAAGSEEIVVGGTVRSEQAGQCIALARGGCRRKPLHQLAKLHGLLLALELRYAVIPVLVT